MAEQVKTQREVRRTLQGIVVSDVRNKTIKVSVEEVVRHERYGKYQRRRTFVHAHDEANAAKKGDVVEIMETRPISKSKTWRLVKVVRAAVAAAELETQA